MNDLKDAQFRKLGNSLVLAGKYLVTGCVWTNRVKVKYLTNYNMEYPKGSGADQKIQVTRGYSMVDHKPREGVA